MLALMIAKNQDNLILRAKEFHDATSLVSQCVQMCYTYAAAMRGKLWLQ